MALGRRPERKRGSWGLGWWSSRRSTWRGEEKAVSAVLSKFIKKNSKNALTALWRPHSQVCSSPQLLGMEPKAHAPPTCRRLH